MNEIVVKPKEATKIVKPSFEKIKSVNARNETVRQAENPRKTIRVLEEIKETGMVGTLVILTANSIVKGYCDNEQRLKSFTKPESADAILFLYDVRVLQQFKYLPGGSLRYMELMIGVNTTPAELEISAGSTQRFLFRGLKLLCI
ncbi:hypothetical protein Tco_1194787 [Tanacetum coccineum]